jgi:hypothetical protein
MSFDIADRRPVLAMTNDKSKMNNEKLMTLYRLCKQKK